MTTLATLRAVPDGEPCVLSAIQNHQFIFFEGHVWVPNHRHLALVRITDNHVYDVAYIWEAGHLFQPVRLETSAA